MPITAPTLSVSDNADNTGGVATLAGGNAGATNSVYYQRVSSIGNMAWTLAGSRVGPGTVAVSVSSGFFWVKCESTLAAETVLSNLVYKRLTQASQAYAEQIVLAIQARIQTLALSGIQSTNVIIQKIPSTTKNNAPVVALPCVIITPYNPESFSDLEGTNESDDIGYRIQISIVDKDGGDQEKNRNRWLLWREEIRKSLHNKRLDSIPTQFTCSVSPNPVYDPAAWFDRGVALGGMIATFKNRENRNT